MVHTLAKKWNLMDLHKENRVWMLKDWLLVKKKEKKEEEYRDKEMGNEEVRKKVVNGEAKQWNKGLKNVEGEQWERREASKRERKGRGNYYIIKIQKWGLNMDRWTSSEGERKEKFLWYLLIGFANSLGCPSYFVGSLFLSNFICFAL